MPAVFGCLWVKISGINVLLPPVQTQKLGLENFLPTINFLHIQNPSYLTFQFD
jgi:hypothetical protein